MPTNEDEKLDLIIRLLEDLFILHALNSKIGRDDIRSVLGVHNSRISKIAKGLKRRKERGPTA
jgi:hypothetical protein